MSQSLNTTIAQVRKAFETEIHDFICRKVGHQDHCNDIMQEVYLKILANIERIEQTDNMNAYVVRMAANAITDYYRKQARQPASTELAERLETGTEEVTIAENDIRLADCCLRPFINSLPAKYQDVLVQVELNGLKLKDYALKAGITLTNAKTRVQRARLKLKEAILQCCNYKFDVYGNVISCCKNNPS